MKCKEYQLLARTVEDGLIRGWNRAHKHADNPDEGSIRDAMYDAVMGEICEWFEFDDEGMED